MEETMESKRQRREGRDALDVLPAWAWLLVLKQLDDYDRIAFGLTCRTFLEAVTMMTPSNPELKKVALKTDLKKERRKGAPGDRYYDHLCDVDLIHLAAFQGSKKVMEWLVSQGIPLGIKRWWSGAAATGAAGGGHIELLEWLRSEGCGFDEETCSYAARGGHLEVLKWLRSQDPPCDWNEATCDGAAIYGHLDVLQWLRSQDPPCPWDDETCKEAARGGHLEVLKWARSQDPPCDWDKWTCTLAAKGGHLEVLQWARS
ncbi:hypothetical protein HOP50_10g58490 [Chloropicon primus]|uniref:Ankyrin repeat domain-containing protein n=1 Tax=Chloropicon primus TaxID=1764295 RepID=A0A5B8MSJ9_9CHLO|nr:hypothetical protein A3770_10p58290 [Chloropicon primus]UPR02523.1 hypothetical protein HOP50_10g58490 [Chloropicon primus]|eukprot:QDZ23311.1 hypothetical protein A3770_10p58290 [Chloropicon primus]